MEVIQADFKKNKESVVELLVRNVLSVNIEIPKVVKGAFWDFISKLIREATGHLKCAFKAFQILLMSTNPVVIY